MQSEVGATAAEIFAFRREQRLLPLQAAEIPMNALASSLVSQMVDDGNVKASVWTIILTRTVTD
jgi:hypothetical protein